MQPLPGGFRRRGYSEIAISPFDPAQLVHASGSDRNAQSRDLVILPSPASNAEWIRQTASVRLSSGCAVTVALESTSAVPLMHMLQVNLILFFINAYPSPSLPPSLPSSQWRPCGSERVDLLLTQFVSESERSPPKLQRHTTIRSAHPIVACSFIENQADAASGHTLIIVSSAAVYCLPPVVAISH